MANQKSIFSKNLSKARDLKNWSQEGVVQAMIKLGEADFTRRKLRSYESGEAEPSHETLERLCQVYNITDLRAFMMNPDYYGLQLSPEDLHYRYNNLPLSIRRVIDTLLAIS